MKIHIILSIAILFATQVFPQTGEIPHNRKAVVMMKDSTRYEGAVRAENDSLIQIENESGILYKIEKANTTSIKYIPYYQNSGTHQAEISFKDGTILRGQIRNETTHNITFFSELTGEKVIPREKILDIKYITDIKSGSNQVYINLASRYFYSPSALNMKKGDGYYQNIYVSLNSFNYAFTDHFSAGGGVEAWSLLFGKPIFFINAKTGIELTHNVHAGVGFLHFNFTLLNSSFSALNLGFGTLTLGNEDYNASVNYGKDLGKGGGDVITLSGFARVGTKFGLITENWIFSSSGNYLISSFGGRIIGRKNLFDFGIITNSDFLNAGILGLPYLSYTLRF